MSNLLKDVQPKKIVARGEVFQTTFLSRHDKSLLKLIRHYQVARVSRELEKKE